MHHNGNLVLLVVCVQRDNVLVVNVVLPGGQWACQQDQEFKDEPLAAVAAVHIEFSSGVQTDDFVSTVIKVDGVEVGLIASLKDLEPLTLVVLANEQAHDPNKACN